MKTQSATYDLVRARGITHRAAVQVDRAVGDDDPRHIALVGPTQEKCFVLIVGNQFAYQFATTRFRARQLSRMPLTDGLLSLDLSRDAEVLGSGADLEIAYSLELVSGGNRAQIGPHRVGRIDETRRFAIQLGVDTQPFEARLAELQAERRSKEADSRRKDAEFAALLNDEEVIRRAEVLDGFAQSVASGMVFFSDRDDVVKAVERLLGVRGISLVNACRTFVLIGFFGASSKIRPLGEKDAALAYRLLERFPEASVNTIKARRTVEIAGDPASADYDATFLARMAVFVDEASAVARASGAEAVGRELKSGLTRVTSLVTQDWDSGVERSNTGTARSVT